MNKKVLGAILFSALFAGTGTFTSCIDSDEPVGIEELRGAKAELIRAKAAVEAAMVAKVQAEAAYVNAQAELAKAQAQAEVLKAERDAAIAESESAAKIAEIEARIAQLKAQTEATIQSTEAAAKQQEVAYQTALLELAKAKAALVGEQQDALEGWIANYDAKVATYNEKYLAYVNAAREYNEAMAALEDNSEDNIEAMRLAEKNLEAKKYQLAMEQEYLAKKEAELEKAKAATPSELQTKKAELWAEYNALVNNGTALELEKAEVRNENRAEYEKYDALREAAGKAYYAEVAIPALTVKDWLGNNVKIFPAAVKYSLNAMDNYNSAYTTLVNRIDQWEGYLMDENDQAWTEAEIIDQKAKLVSYEKTYNTDKARWETAVAVYNTADGSVNMAAFTGYDVVKDAADAFNATLPTYKAAVAAEKAARDTYAAKVKAYEEAGDAYDDYNEAVKAINEKYEARRKELVAAIAAVETELQAEITELRDAVKQAEIDYERTLADYTAGLVRESAVERALSDIEDAKEELQDALDEFNEELDEETEDYILELNALDQYKHADILEADLNLEKALRELDVNGKDPALEEAINAAYAALVEAQKAVTAADKASNTAYAALDKAYTEFKKTIPFTPNFLPTPDYTDFTNLVVSLTRAEAKAYVELTSGIVWGETIAQNDKDDEMSISSSYLVKGLTQADINNILATYETVDPADYYAFYTSFGSFGTYLNQTEQLVRYETALANVDATKTSIESLVTALNNLIAGYNANVAAYNTAWNAVYAQQKVIDTFEKEVMDKIAKNDADEKWTLELWTAYQSACTELGDNTSVIELANVVRSIESQIRDQKQKIYDMETAVMKAEKALEDWNNGEYDAVEDAKLALEDAEFELNVAKTAVEEAKAYLDAAIKALEAVTE